MTRAGSLHALSHRQTAILLLYAALALLPVLGSQRALTRHEVLAAHPAREMLAGNGWLIQPYAGQRRTNKPPGATWIIAGSMWSFGSTHEWVVRLPFALCGIATCLMVGWLGVASAGRKIGLAAGLIHASMLSTQVQARLAEADMALIALVCGALCAFARGAMLDAHRPFVWSMLFHGLAGLTVIVKGPIGLLFIYLTATTFAAWQRKRETWRFILNPAGLCLMLVLAAAWPVAAVVSHPELAQVWRRELFGRAMGEMASPEPWFQYLLDIPILLLPWLPLVVVGLHESWRRDWLKSDWARLIVCWLVPGTLVLSTLAWKHKHYVMPLLPGLSIVAAIGVDRLLRARPPWSARTRRILGAVWVLGACAVGILLALLAERLRLDRPERMGNLRVGVLVVSLCAASLAGILFTRSYKRAATGLFGTVVIGILAIQALIEPAFDGYAHARQFARRVNHAVPDDRPIYLVGIGEAHVAYYLRLPLIRIENPRDVPARVKIEPAYLIGKADDAKFLESQGNIEVLDQVDRLRRTQAPGDRLVLLRYVSTNPGQATLLKCASYSSATSSADPEDPSSSRNFPRSSGKPELTWSLPTPRISPVDPGSPRTSS